MRRLCCWAIVSSSLIAGCGKSDEQKNCEAAGKHWRSQTDSSFGVVDGKTVYLTTTRHYCSDY